MATEVSSISGSAAQLALAEETTIGVLPGSPVWFNLVVNSYGDFGSNLNLESRRVISQRRRRKRGDIVSEDASAGFVTDFTPTVTTKLMPAVMLANWNEHPKKGTVFDTGITVAGTPADYDIGTDAAVAGWEVGHLLYAENFSTAANNGLKQVTGVTGNTIEVSGLTAEASPPDTAVIRAVGIQFGSAELDVVKSGSAYPQLNIASGTLDFTNFPQLVPGSRVYIDKANGASSNRFVNAENNGHMRVLSVTATDLTLDRVDGGSDGETDMTSETGTGLSIRLFFADRIADEALNNTRYNRISHTAERQLGEPNPVANPGDIQTEDVLGAVTDTCVISVQNRSKSVVEYSLLGISAAEHTGQAGDLRLTEGVTPLEIEESEFMNNSSHVVRSVLSTYPAATSGNAAPSVLVNFVTEYEIALSNQASILPAVGRTSGFDINTLDFVADVTLTNWFTDIATKKSIRANDRIQFEIAWQRPFNNRTVGVLMDFPSCALGDGIVSVDIDNAMQQPLRLEAADSVEHDQTVSYNVFWFIP